VTPEARKAGRDALIAFAVTAVLVTLLVRINVELPAIGHVGGALIAVTFLYVPVAVAWWRDEDLHDYAFHAEPIKRGLVLAGIAILIAFPIFALGYLGFYELACNTPSIAKVAPPGLCLSYTGWDHLHAPALVWVPLAKDSFVDFALVQLVVVGLTEELFFRGMLLKLLEQRFPPKRRWKGGGIGLALVLSSAAFALVHLPRTGGDPRELIKFFPGLLFGWMRSATGSILAGTITHGSANILVRIIELASKR
jgi:membrane protease YdiL (CAAX protease family)